MSVISSNPDKPFQELTTQMSGFPMLPRKIFPHAWTPVKEVVAHTLAKYAAVASHDAAALASTDVVAAAVLAAATSGDLADAQAIAAASPQQLVAPQGLSKQLEKTLDDIEATAAGRVRIPGGCCSVHQVGFAWMRCGRRSVGLLIALTIVVVLPSHG